MTNFIEQLKTSVKSHIETVGKGITALTDYSHKLKDVINEANESSPKHPQLDTALLSLQQDIVGQNKWAESMHTRAETALINYDKKRASLFPMKRDRSHFHLPPAKRRALAGDMDLCETIQSLSALVEELKKLTQLDIKIRYFQDDDLKQPIGISVTSEGVFQAWILFKDTFPENEEIEISRIRLFSTNEKGGMWKQSTFHLYQRITRHATTAIQHFAEYYSGKSLYHLVKWLSFYTELYSTPCKKCGKIFFFASEENPMALPTYRTYRTLTIGTAYHPECYCEP